MNFARGLLYVLGAGLVIVGLFMLFVETGLAAWVPTGIAIAGLVVLLGLFVMGLSDRAETRRGTVREEHHHHERRH